MNRARRARSCSSLSYPRSQLWVSSNFFNWAFFFFHFCYCFKVVSDYIYDILQSTIYEGLKHAVPWKSKKLNKEF